MLDVLFPPRCAGCGSGTWPFCRRCRTELEVLSPPWCERCGAPSHRTVSGCRDCPPRTITSARAPFRFEGPVRRAVHRLKFAGWRPVAGALAEAMVSAWGIGRNAGSVAPEIVTWVPLSRDRLAARGYDQAKALAGAVAPRLGLPASALLRRVGDPGPQARRGGEARREAMRGMFAAARTSPACVLLVDDVLTTGATASACAEALLRAGAREVCLLTAARAVAGARRSAGGPRAGAFRDAAPAPARGPILALGLVSGSVVAPGKASPAVDASRGRSDPRKPTLGR
jgi:predicted amidophosphoribosyltransferase